MELTVIKEAEELVSRNSNRLTDKEKEFVFQFAIETEDSELTQFLVMDFIEENKDSEGIMEKYHALCDERPNWLHEIISNLVALEMLCIRQEQAIFVLSDMLHARGIEAKEELMKEKQVEEETPKEKKETII